VRATVLHHFQSLCSLGFLHCVSITEDAKPGKQRVCPLKIISASSCQVKQWKKAPAKVGAPNHLQVPVQSAAA
jgi:hypothetical protein